MQLMNDIRDSYLLRNMDCILVKWKFTQNQDMSCCDITSSLTMIVQKVYPEFFSL